MAEQGTELVLSEIPDFLLPVKQSGLPDYDYYMPKSGTAQLRMSVTKEGTFMVTFSKELVGYFQGANAAPTGIIGAVAMPRAFWKDKQSTSGVQPYCKSADGITGRGKFTVLPGTKALIPSDDGKYVTADKASVDVQRDCSTCPMSKFGSGEGNAQACKQMVRLAIFFPLVQKDGKYNHDFLVDKMKDAEGELVPTPVFLSLTPVNMREWGNYVRMLKDQGVGFNMVWTKFEPKKETTKSGHDVGIVKLGAMPMKASHEVFYKGMMAMLDHPAMENFNEAGSEDDYAQPGSTGKNASNDAGGEPF